MILKDIYDQLAYGELRQVFQGTGGIGTENDGIKLENYPRLLPSVTLGLTELHKRFMLNEGRVTIERQTGQVSYTISKVFSEAYTKSTVTPKYIKDAASPYQDNLLKIESVKGIYLTKEVELPLNDRDNPQAIRTTSYNTILIPSDTDLAPWLLETTNLELTFRADHPEIDTGKANASPFTTEIFLPPQYLEPLLYYIASKQLNPAGIGQEFHEGNNYYSKFETACARLVKENLDIDNNTYSTKFQDRGFA